MENQQLQKTPLYNICREAGARFTPFAGWNLPLQFSGILQEVEAVREKAGLFDVSHMGEIEITGPGATLFLNKMLTNDVEKAGDGRIIYTIICFPDGGTLDDLLVYKYSSEHFLLVVNAINTEAVLRFLKTQANAFQVKITDRSAAFALLALQGPAAAPIISKALSPAVLSLKPFRFQTLVWQEEQMIISRTGYTGEDGFEIYLPPTLAEQFWRTLMQVGKDSGLLPAGLGARDVLRQEAGLPLYGQELSPQISPVQAGLESFIAWEKAEFSGHHALRIEQKNPLTPKRIGFVSARAAIPRPGFDVYWEGRLIGKVTSGTYSPTLQKAIGMALVNPVPPVGTIIQLQIRGKFQPAELVALPFYKRKR
ncbi:MAG: glycine cleavage system aminomethyltransferase GcvT [Firmicutes bacterium]|nr:glycine cleavage system aminomethyltransferase GcvT [Bacillota bacterium]